MHHRARRQCAVVHVRAGADVEEELRQAQQAAAGRADDGRQEVAKSISTRRSKKLDDEMVATFKKNNVEVVTLTPAEYDAWLKIAQESSYKQFASEVSGRQEADRRSARGEIARDRAAGRQCRRPICLAGRLGKSSMDNFIRGVTLLSQACGIFAAGSDRGQRGDRLPDGVHALCAQRQHDLADRFRHLTAWSPRPSSARLTCCSPRATSTSTCCRSISGRRARCWLALVAIADVARFLR